MIYDFRRATSVPTITETVSNTFNGIPATSRIIIPDSLYDTWIADSNWSQLSKKIVKASQSSLGSLT